MPYEPCPLCHKRPEKLATRVAQMVAPSVRSACLVCWPCNVIAECGDGQTATGAWASIAVDVPDDTGDIKAIGKLLKSRSRARRARDLDTADPTGWRHPSPYHWQRDLHGDLLDYWPSKRKWRWRGRIQTGDVQKFIREARP